MDSQVKNLKAWALSHYEDGGHWVYETYSEADWQAALKNGFAAAKKALRAHWELMNTRAADCAA